MSQKPSARAALFPKLFLVSLNATKAARECGFSAKSARQAGARMLSNAAIKAEIMRLMEKRQEKLEITADQWLRELAIIGFSNMPDYLTIEEGGGVLFKTFEDMPKDASRAIEAVEEIRTISEKAGDKKTPSTEHIINDRIKFKLHSKLDALKTIGEHLGFLKSNRLELPGVEKALYELSEKFLPAVKAKKRSDVPE